MVCPKCGHRETQVTDSRDGPESIRRRRECLNCRYRFTTHEKVETPVVLVLKKNGDQERFDPEKIRRGVHISCKNRPVTSAQVDSLVEEVASRIYFTGKEEISSKEIGGQVQELLYELDQVAYLRFISVYRAFTNLKQFEQEIHNIH